MKFLKILFIVIVSLIAACFIIGLFIPKKFKVVREVTINQPDSIVFEYVKDLNNFAIWNNWTGNHIPNIKNTVTGKGTEKGDVLYWKGEKTGEGNLEILDYTKYTLINERVSFTVPFKLSQNSCFKLIPNIDNTKTTLIWTFEGESKNTIDKIFALSYNQTIGADFEKGLERVKNNLEKH